MEPATQQSRATPTLSTGSGPDLCGTTFGDFRILRQLGQGGMGRVYLAEQISLQRKVAIKVLREDIAGNPTALERFKSESKIVAQLSHPNVVQVHMVGKHEGRRFMVLEYVEGKSLRDYLLRKGSLDVMLVLSLMRQVAAALQRASELGIVHRDIKPENILLNRKGEAKVADFGLSRCLTLDQPVDLTRDGTTVGTPLYMSPEQVEGKEIDSRSDIYSFGVTCYHMLAGKTPFTGSNAFGIALKHVREEPTPLESIRPDLPAALCAVVGKMMAKKRSARYQSARDLLKDLSRVRDSLSGTIGSLPVGSLIAETILDADAPPGTARDASPTLAAQREDKASRPSASKGSRNKVLASVPLWKQPIILVGGALGTLGILAVAFGSIGWYVWTHRPATPDTTSLIVDGLPPSASVGESDTQREREDSLRKVVEQHLKESSPNPNGVEACIDLSVLYLEQNKVSEAESLFKRMDERRAPSSYHYVGRLGLAVTDALTNNARASHAKFTELFDSKSKDNRVQVLNDYLTKNPEFAKWVNEADSHNVRNGVSESSIPQGLRRFPSKPPFKRS
jgi:serine/threonine protein kinase